MKTSLGQFLAKDSAQLSARQLALLSFELDAWRFVGSRVVAQQSTPGDGGCSIKGADHSATTMRDDDSLGVVPPSVLDAIKCVDCVRSDLVKLDYEIPAAAAAGDLEEVTRRLRALPVISRKLDLPWDASAVNEHQDAKDIGRDEINFNGEFFRGAEIGYAGIVERVAGLVNDDVAKILLSCLNRFVFSSTFQKYFDLSHGHLFIYFFDHIWNHILISSAAFVALWTSKNSRDNNTRLGFWCPWISIRKIYGYLWVQKKRI